MNLFYMYMPTYDVIITNSHIVLPNKIIEKNIVIDEGKIISITNDNPQCDIKINATGLISIPGVIDPHVHYGVYSPIKQAASTESHVAAIGGITSIMRMFRTTKLFSDVLPSNLSISSNSHYTDYSIHASIFNEQQADEISYCINHDVMSFKLYLNLGSGTGKIHMDMDTTTNTIQESIVEMNYDLIKYVIKKAALFNCPVLVHAEDHELCYHNEKRARSKNTDGLKTWSTCRSGSSEALAIKNISELAREFNCILYFVHIGSIFAMKQIMQEKKKGTKIYVETCPHYLTLSYDTYHDYKAKVMPPIRSIRDVNYIWNSLSNNEIDTIGTDHVANKLDLKIGKNIWDSLAGFPGLGTYLSILLSEGINKNKISLFQLVKLTSTNTAKIFGMHPNKGSLQKNSDADITLVDLKKEIKVQDIDFGGYSDYGVYDDMKLKGWPIKTLLRGKIIADNFKVVGTSGYGKIIKRCITEYQNSHLD
ncbi:MAG: dihydroorotase family protein [Thaumarchaeota archaeon]|nr:dihydroorotase family protein [Nitrososphaerota archaeon]